MSNQENHILLSHDKSAVFLSKKKEGIGCVENLVKGCRSSAAGVVKGPRLAEIMAVAAAGQTAQYAKEAQLGAVEEGVAVTSAAGGGH